MVPYLINESHLLVPKYHIKISFQSSKIKIQISDLWYTKQLFSKPHSSLKYKIGKKHLHIDISLYIYTITFDVTIITIIFVEKLIIIVYESKLHILCIQIYIHI